VKVTVMVAAGRRAHVLRARQPGVIMDNGDLTFFAIALAMIVAWAIAG